MKSTLIQRLQKPVLILLLIVFSLNSYAQQTFTIVCDKTDNLVKIVESQDRSPNYVPIKGGFPFRQVAQKWIDENMSTTQCNPGEIKKQIQKQTKTTNNKTPVKSTAPAVQQHYSSVRGSTNQSLKPAVHYRNTSFLLNAKISNLGEAFNLDSKLMPGFEAGIEQLFGNKFYLGTGINMDLYLSDFDSRYAVDQELIYFFRIPAFVGYRWTYNKFATMWEAGMAVNTAFTGTELNLESFGKTANSNSFNFLARMKVGTEQIMLEFGSEIWFTDVFEASIFNMSVFYMGLRFSF